MRLGALGESLGVTQNPPACQPGCQAARKPHGPGQVSEPLRTWWSSSSVIYPAFLKILYIRKFTFTGAFSLHISPEGVCCPSGT